MFSKADWIDTQSDTQFHSALKIILVIDLLGHWRLQPGGWHAHAVDANSCILLKQIERHQSQYSINLGQSASVAQPRSAAPELGYPNWAHDDDIDDDTFCIEAERFVWSTTSHCCDEYRCGSEAYELLYTGNSTLQRIVLWEIKCDHRMQKALIELSRSSASIETHNAGFGCS